MVVDATQISRIRLITFAITGLVCLSYAALALIQDRPDPMPWWLPGGFGVASGLVITWAARIAGHDANSQAWDELYKSVARRSAAQAYWVSMVLFVATHLLGLLFDVNYGAAMAALGTSMGASYLILFVWHDLRLS